MKIDVAPSANNEEKLRNVAKYLERIKDVLADISTDYDEVEDKDIAELLEEALEAVDDSIYAANDAADEIEALE